MKDHLSEWLTVALAVAITVALGAVLDIDYTAFAMGPILFVVSTTVVGVVLDVLRRRLLGATTPR